MKGKIAMTALILGILSIIIGWLPILGWALIIAGIITGAIAVSKRRKLSYLALILSLAAMVLWTSVIVAGAMTEQEETDTEVIEESNEENETRVQRIPEGCRINDDLSCEVTRMTRSVIEIEITNTGADVGSFSIALDPELKCASYEMPPEIASGETEEYTFLCTSLPKEGRVNSPIDAEYQQEGERESFRGYFVKEY